MSTDAFAAAAAAQSAVTAPAQSGQGEGTAGSETVKADLNFGLDNPFLTNSDVNTGGEIGPRVPWEDIVGRLVVMIPQSFTEKSIKAERFRKSADDLYQPVADVDLFVLGGEPFSFEYKVPAGNPADPNAVKYETHNVTELPYVELKRRIFSGSLAWTVKRTMDQRGLLWGIFAYGPQNATARKSGQTVDTVSAAMEQWISRGRKGDSPKFTYVLDDRAHVFTDAHKAIAGAWWSEYRKTL